MGWAEEEFESLDLGDSRLNRRAVLLAQRLSQKSGASIPGACANWSETVAGYRFLDNEEVNWDDVMAAHWQASQQRMAQHGGCCAYKPLGVINAWMWAREFKGSSENSDRKVR